MTKVSLFPYNYELIERASISYFAHERDAQCDEKFVHTPQRGDIKSYKGLSYVVFTRPERNNDERF